MLPLLIHFFNKMNNILLKKILVGGKRKNNPVRSVIKPGVSNNIPPMIMQSPSKIASPGILPYRSCSCAFLIVSSPSRFAKYVPNTPVPMISKMVGTIPIVLPENRRRPISAAGMIINSNNKYLILQYLPPRRFPLKEDENTHPLPSIIRLHDRYI